MWDSNTVPPLVATWPSWLLAHCVNQIVFWGPAAIDVGVPLVAISLIAPAVVILPILLEPPSANQSAPSDPVVIPFGKLLAVGNGNCVNTPQIDASNVMLNDSVTGMPRWPFRALLLRLSARPS